MTATVPSHHIKVDSFESIKSQNFFTDCVGPLVSITPLDNVDNPLISESGIAERNIFQQMKSECNRLYSFQNKWPLREISPENLAEAGLFYLQEEDKVQCPFCKVKLFDWTHGDKPLREHIRKSPKCPFLMGCDVGNIPLVPGKDQQTPLSHATERKYLSPSVSVSYKPRHPRMADFRKRILTFSNWPLNQPTPLQLAECGLYYSGIADVVTCFFCGGALGNWEPNDDAWYEHAKFFPDCAFLAVSKNKSTRSPRVLAGSRQESKESELKQDPVTRVPSPDIISDIIAQAQVIFPENLVLQAVKNKNGKILSLQELCDDILELKLKQNNSENNAVIPEDTKSKINNSASSNDVLLCKVCMDREKGAVFQPCGHFVSCWNCANLISNCPVCRRPITHKIRTYNS